MKLFDLFKKETTKEVKNNIQKMEKKQLEKVIGGGGPDIINETSGAINTSRSNIRNPA